MLLVHLLQVKTPAWEDRTQLETLHCPSRMSLRGLKHWYVYLNLPPYISLSHTSTHTSDRHTSDRHTSTCKHIILNRVTYIQHVWTILGNSLTQWQQCTTNFIAKHSAKHNCHISSHKYLILKKNTVYTVCTNPINITGLLQLCPNVPMWNWKTLLYAKEMSLFMSRYTY